MILGALVGFFVGCVFATILADRRFDRLIDSFSEVQIAKPVKESSSNFAWALACALAVLLIWYVVVPQIVRQLP